MNTFYGEAKELPFDLSHVRHPIQYNAHPKISDAERRKLREKLSIDLETIIRAMATTLAPKPDGIAFVPTVPVREPAFFFHAADTLTQFGREDEELRFKRSRAIYIRLYPTFSEQPRVGKTGASKASERLATPERAFSTTKTNNKWGSISVMPHGTGTTSLSQIFPSGEIWGISEIPFRASDGLHLINAEICFMTAVNNYRQIYETELKLNPPFTIEYGVTGINGQHIFYPTEIRGSAMYQAGPFVQDSFHRKYNLSSFDQSEWEKTLSEFLVELYDEVRLERAAVLTPDDIRANQLPLLL